METEKILEKKSGQNELSAPKVELSELKKFIDRFDPYQPVSKPDQEFLKKLNIHRFNDPFYLSNQLILLVEDLIEKRS